MASVIGAMGIGVALLALVTSGCSGAGTGAAGTASELKRLAPSASATNVTASECGRFTGLLYQTERVVEAHSVLWFEAFAAVARAEASSFPNPQLRKATLELGEYYDQLATAMARGRPAPGQALATDITRTVNELCLSRRGAT